MNPQPYINGDIGKKAVVYLRVSTEEQVENFSLETQEELCRKEAVKRGYEVIEIFKEEGKSAKTITGRPVLISLLEFCRKNRRKVHAVFVYRIDRISRQTQDYLAIRKKLADCGVLIISINEPTGDSPTEKLVETILAGFAQLDNDVRSERTRNGMRARFLSGLICTKPPLGYKWQAGYAIKDQETYDKVKEAWDLIATGTKSLKEMAKIMSDWELYEMVKGKKHSLRAQTANRIFRNKFYMGTLTSRTYPDEVQGQHVPMITEEQFYKVQAILDGRNTNRFTLTKRNFQNTDFPLRRLVRCGKCGQGLTGGWATGRWGGKYAYYWCSSKCNYKTIKVKELENAVLTLLKEKVQPTKECIDLFIAYLYKTYHERLSRLKKMQDEADLEIARIKTLRQQLVEKNLSGIYSDEIFKEQNALLEEKLTQAQILKEDAKLDKYNIEAVTTFVKTMLGDLGDPYKRSSIPQLKVLLGSVFPFGLSWNYDGTLNPTISPIYQYIRHFEGNVIPLGTPEDNLFEPHLIFWFDFLLSYSKSNCFF